MAKKKPANPEDVTTQETSPPASTSPAPITPGHSSDDYVVVARRYRPKSFGELVGQDHVGRALANAIETSRVGHAYLFTGARGVGKTSTARIFAKALNNPAGASATFDSQSDIAEAIDAGEDVDVIEIDGASNRGIDEIRSLRANVGVRPSRARYKIYIIDEVHMLTGAAFNALLKTLEEPPEHVKFIFCTTDPEKIPITVLSRCQRFDFAPVEVSQIVGRLEEIIAGENATASPQALELIARRAAGSMRDSQSLLEQVMSFSDGHLDVDTVHAMLGTADDTRLHAMAAVMAQRDAAAALAMLDQAIDAGVDPGRLAEQLLGYFRDLLAVTVGCDAKLQRHTSVSMHEELKSLGEHWGLQTVLAVVGLVDQTLVRIRHSVYARVLLEATLVQICNLPDLQAIADLAAAAGDASASGKQSPKKQAAEKQASPKSANAVSDEKAATPSEPAAGEKKKLTTDHAATQTGSAITNHPPTADAIDHAAVQKSAVQKSAGELAIVRDAPDHRDVDQTLVDRVWPDVIEQLPDETASMVRHAQAVTLQGQTLKIEFDSNHALTLRRCDTPTHREAILAALQAHTKSPLKIELAAKKAIPLPTKEDAPATPKVGKRERMKQIEAHPLVCACIEQLDAEVMKIDHPRG